MQKNILILGAAGLLLSAFICKKPANTCEEIQQVKITGAQASYYTGDAIHLSTSATPDGFYSWHQSQALNEISTSPQVSVDYCTKYDEGWYYLALSNPDCTSRYDSVYITVKNKPVTPPCSPANNGVSFSSIPSISFSSTTWAMDPTWNCRNLRGYQGAGYPDINIYFNTYWNTREPEDGEYSVASTLTFPDNNLYTIFFASTYSSVYFQAQPGKAYVTHTNGKLQVTFCGLTFSGSLGGPSFTTTATGKLTAP
jgi:hypothetical protein